MTQTPETRARHRDKLRTAFGPAIAAALSDPETLEIMVNPDGRLWLDLMGKGKVATDHQLRPEEVERIIAWGRALRLAQRLSGGTEALLRKTSIAMMDGKIVLLVPQKYRQLYSEAVERRLGQLARSLKREAEMRLI